VKEKHKKELLEIINNLQAGRFEGVETSLEELHKIYPADPTVISVFGEFLFATQRYSKYIEVFSPFIKLDCELVDALYRLGFSYYKLENFTEAKSFIYRALSINHTQPGLFDVVSELKVIDSMLNSYDRLKNDPWYLLGSAKVFRKFGHRLHFNKFLDETKIRFPYVLELDYIKCELELLELLDTKQENKINELFTHYGKNNPNIAVILHYHNFFNYRSNFSKDIAR
jgi:tetratricopeptide (TPR) repeat protein